MQGCSLIGVGGGGRGGGAEPVALQVKGWPANLVTQGSIPPGRSRSSHKLASITHSLSISTSYV